MKYLMNLKQNRYEKLRGILNVKIRRLVFDVSSFNGDSVNSVNKIGTDFLRQKRPDCDDCNI